MNRTGFRNQLQSLLLGLSALTSFVVGQSEPLSSRHTFFPLPPAVRPAPPPPAPKDNSAQTVLKELLALPAPPPGGGGESAEGRGRPDDFFDYDRSPKEDAPIEDLLDYWKKVSNTGLPDGPKITDRIKERLLAAAEEDPEVLTSLLDCMPAGREAALRIQRLYDASQNNPDLDDDWRSRVRNYLRLNTTLYLPDLVRLANKAKDTDGAIENETQVVALAKVDRESAIPVLRGLLTSGQPRTAALALSWFFRYAIEDGDSANAELYLHQLKEIAADHSAPGAARNEAIDGLSTTEWEGRDEWYLSLFADESLLELADQTSNFTPLTTLFDQQPSRWIPVMARLLESQDPAVRRNAGNCLTLYLKDNPKREAIQPLLRWLGDPAWLPLESSARNFLVTALRTVVMPESVPGLIWIVANDDPSKLSAAQTLAAYKDPRAIPALKLALSREDNENARQYLLEGLLACGGLSDAEGVEGLEQYTERIQQNGGDDRALRYLVYSEEKLPLPQSIGRYLAQKDEVPESLANAVFVRALQLQRSDPGRAQALLKIAQQWKGRRIDVDLVQRINSGTADAALISGGLERREDLMKTVPAELRALAATHGSVAGIAAVLVNDEALSGQILGGQDQNAQIALLASARLVQMKLLVAPIAHLLRSGSPLLAQAAEKYLLAEDSREARQALWERYPQQGYITGWREKYRIGESDLTDIEKIEAALREEVMASRPGAPQQIFAWLAQTAEPRRVIRVYADRITDTNYLDASRYTERTLTPEAMGAFRRSLAANQLTEAGPDLSDCGYECRMSEFLALSRGGGRRMLVTSNGTAAAKIEEGLGQAAPGEARTRYYLQNAIPGAEVLLEADSTFVVKRVIQEAGILQVQTEREPTDEEQELMRQERVQLQRAGEDQLDNAEELEAEIAGKRSARDHSRVTWHAFVDGRLREQPSSPALTDLIDYDARGLEPGEYPDYWNERPAQSAAGEVLILAGRYGRNGLWRVTKNQGADLISDEKMYLNPVVTPDGRWVVAAKVRNNFAEPNDVVRINISSRTEYPVQLPGAHQFAALAYLPPSGKILLRRARDDDDDPKNTDGGPPQPEFYLLDAETGKTQLVKGDFSPLLQTGNRKLQPAAKPDEVWAALPSDNKNETRLVRYNLRTFTLQTVMTIPQLTFTSEDMWVDEAKGKVYIVFEGQLISVPLTPIVRQ